MPDSASPPAGALGTSSLRSRLAADASLAQSAVICGVAALVSLLFTGALFGVGNHVFHLPIIHRLYDEPQFANDAFIQSLRHYAAGVWLLLSGADRYAGDGKLLFLVLLYVTRVLVFAGFLACASLLGVRSVGERIIFSLIICFTPILDGASFAGHGGLFVNSFGHSELAVGTVLLTIYFAARVQIAAAILCGGVTFFINAFMGVWLIAPVAAIIVWLLVQREIIVAQLWRQVLIGGIGSALLAIPVLHNVLSNPDFGMKLSFDYATYLREYFGGHFLIDANPLSEIALLFALAVLAWLSLSQLQSRAAAFKAGLIGIFVLYMIGVIVPFVTHSQPILNLHLLRAGMMIHLIAALGAGVVATKWLCSSDSRYATVLGPYLLFTLWIRNLFPVAILLIPFSTTIRERIQDRRDSKLRAVILAALLGVVIPWEAWQYIKVNSLAEKSAREWDSVGHWAKASTPPDSLFLILLGNTEASGEVSAAEPLHVKALIWTSPLFEATAHRRIWVDFKRGAAVMWQPSYYQEWRTRMSAVAVLQTPKQKIDYARANGIGYLVDDCRDVEAAGIKPAFRSDRLCVTKVADAPL
jgi:hypothetical protein